MACADYQAERPGEHREHRGERGKSRPSVFTAVPFTVIYATRTCRSYRTNWTAGQSVAHAVGLVGENLPLHVLTRSHGATGSRARGSRPPVFSAAATTVKWRLARGPVGKIEASTTRKPGTAMDLAQVIDNGWGSAAGPMRQVLDG